MKKIIIIIIIGILALVSCNQDSTFQIKITGTEGLEFSGNYLVTTSGGQTISKSIEGIIPKEYSVTGIIVSATFQKQVDEGILRIEIIKIQRSLPARKQLLLMGLFLWLQIKEGYS